LSRIYKQACPACRSPISYQNLLIQNETLVECNSNKKPKTLDTQVNTAINLIKSIIGESGENNETQQNETQQLQDETNGKRILFFSSYSDIYLKVIELLKQQNINCYHILNGSPKQREVAIKKYKKGELKILFLNCIENCAGIDLPETTDIILYHRIQELSIKNQIIGRANRIGCSHQVYIHEMIEHYD
jgi:ERCC4-related helicase